jgi:hypothetical protein
MSEKQPRIVVVKRLSDMNSEAALAGKVQIKQFVRKDLV